MSTKDPRLESFEDAWRDGSSGFARECNCGRVFYDTYNQWDTDDEELEHLAKTATGVPYGCESITFEGRSYSRDCDCWHQRAMKVIQWLDENRRQVVEYYNTEKKRKLKEAEALEEVNP